MTDLAKLARGLTDAQWSRLYFPNGYADPNTVKAMRRKGLIEKGALSDLGHRLKAHIERNEG